jgi:3-hydroxyacyl-[acyl-carrier-protein] dehydratase
MKPMNIEEIKEYLPHRYPFLLIDRVVEWEKDRRIVALKNVTANEPFFQGHFPHFAVMPGVLVVEAMAQAAAMLGLLSMGQKNDGKHVLLPARRRALRAPCPGDQLVLGRATAHVARPGQVPGGGAVAAEGELLCVLRPVQAGA